MNLLFDLEVVKELFYDEIKRKEHKFMILRKAKFISFVPQCNHADALDFWNFKRLQIMQPTKLESGHKYGISIYQLLLNGRSSSTAEI